MARLSRLLSRLADEIRDAIELIALPGLAVLLPWPLCFRIYRRIAGCRWLYRNATEQALREARERGWVGDDVTTWLRKRRLVTLVDHADYFLARFRTDGWMHKYLHVQGAWPAPDAPSLLCTFHWGAGMWGLRHAHSCGLSPHALVAALRGEHFAGRKVLHGYAVARTAEVARALGNSTLDTSASLRPVVKTLRQNGQVLAAIDVPSDQVLASEEIQLIGMQARVPRGLLRLAVELRVPVTVYVTGLRFEDGHRVLSIKSLGVRDDLDTLVEDVFSILDHVIRQEPPAWHFWSESTRFFSTTTSSVA